MTPGPAGGRKRSWRELSGAQRAALIVAASVQMCLLVAALRDLRARPARKVNGPKALWTAVVFVNFVGPLAYFRFGRRG